jgi:hypothetical protein
MARVLGFAAALLLIVAALGAGSIGRATTWYSSKQSTGYAFGSWGGSAPWLGELAQGHFANHSTSWCPLDPAAGWPYGTWIWSTSPAPTMWQGDGSVAYPTSFMLHDIGDPFCTRSHYWVDFYFGRYKNPWDSCYCYNETELCYNNEYYVNNCQDASAHGLTYISYYGP